MKKNVNRWMTVSKGVPDVLGFMYTTWRREYAHMKEYFQLVDTYTEWAEAAPAGK